MKIPCQTIPEREDKEGQEKRVKVMIYRESTSVGLAEEKPVSERSDSQGAPGKARPLMTRTNKPVGQRSQASSQSCRASSHAQVSRNSEFRSSAASKANSQVTCQEMGTWKSLATGAGWSAELPEEARQAGPSESENISLRLFQTVRADFRRGMYAQGSHQRD